MKITVKGQQAIVTDDFLVANSVGIYECEFEFDSSWDGYAKNSVWQLNNDEPKESIISSGVAEVPWEVLVNGGFIRVGVYGTKDEKVMPTVWGEKRKVHLGTPTGSIGTEPTPSIYAQILAVATEAKDIAEDVQTEWENVTAEAETLPSGSSATASFSDGVFSFGIPQGQQGERGEQGEKGEQGETGNGIEEITATKTGLVTTFTIHFTDGTEYVFFLSDGAGISNITLNADYTLTITLTNGRSYTTTSIRGEKGEKGDKGDKGDRGERGEQGETGNGIASITKTATVGKVDTYTITYTDGTTTTFDVTNGEVTEASLEEALYDKADVILNSASGTIASFDDGSAMPVKSLEVEINAVQAGNGDPSPTNIRPISGWSAVNVFVRGINQWDEEWELGTWGSTAVGAVKKVESSTQIRNKNLIPVKPNTTYRILTSTDTSGFFIVLLDDGIFNEWGNAIGTAIQRSSGSTYKVFTTGANTHYIGFSMAASYGTTYNNDISINYPSTDHEYHAYNGTTYPITLPQTVWGAKGYPIEGKTDVTHVIADLGDLTWTYHSAYNTFVAAISDLKTVDTSDCARYLMCCSSYKIVNMWWTSSSKPDKSISQGSGNYICVKDTAYTDVTSFKTAMSGVQLVYELATPIEIPITEIDMSTLYGVNNIWADSGNVAVIYRADTKAYIDGTIVDVPLAMIAPIETGTKSSKAYAVGEYFILNGNQFCKAKTAIASGATFTLNTNYTVTTIATELKALQ